jgi:hypothetical protein
MNGDWKKELKHLYNPTAKEFALVDVPPLQFLMIDGQGDPNTAAEYSEALAALYPLAYTLKFMSKRELDRDYSVPPLEGLWWAEDRTVFTATAKGNRDAWLWRMMIMTPDWLDQEAFERATAEVRRKKNPAALEKVRLEMFHEGLSVQILHIGPYSAEGPTIARLHGELIPQQGLVENGEHHEIYLGDPRRSAPEKLKTILRQPVRKVEGSALG